ncbi:MAG: Wzz/FepE/Etk N-terminal domain-containing protein [Hyphomicrobiaceae bacterium]|nr:Wzz/FepE/Etk N-terminal domain-containing protein [Hyphomicrobiaceae bacterium]
MRPKHDAGQRYRRVGLSSDIHYPSEASTITLDLRSIWRHRWGIAGIVFLFVALGIAFVMLRPTWYSASTRLVVDHRNPSLTVNNTVFMTSDLSGSLVDSQVEILRSQKVMARALALLKPEDRQALLPGPSLVSRAMTLFAIKDDAELTDEQLQTLMLAQLGNLITVTRLGETFTIEILAHGSSPQLAVQLATAMTDAFLEDQAKANANAARGASPWLLERLKNSGTSARVIANATIPLAPDGPNAKYVIIAFAFAGAIMGIGVAFTYDILDTRIRTPEQAADVAAAECLGIMNVLCRGELRAGTTGGGRKNRWVENYPLPADLRVLNSCCIAATIERPDLQTLGVTSCTPGEGKSTITVNLARAIAASGQRVLLVDAARDSQDLSLQLTNTSTKAKNGLLGVLFGKTDLQESVIKEPGTGVHFLPYGSHARHQNESSIWAHHNLNLQRLTSKYDVVIFDLPAINADCSARAAAQLLDGMLLVVEYGKLPEDAAHKILEQAGSTRNSFLGVVLNKVDEAKYKTYASLKPKYRRPVRPAKVANARVSTKKPKKRPSNSSVLQFWYALPSISNFQIGRLFKNAKCAFHESRFVSTAWWSDQLSSRFHAMRSRFAQCGSKVRYALASR